MKKIILIFLLFSVSCVSVHIGPNTYQFFDGKKFPKTYEISYIFNQNVPIDYYKNFEMKIDVLKIDYESTIYRTFNKKRGF